MPKRDAFAPLFGNTQQMLREYGVVVKRPQLLSPRHGALVRQSSKTTTALAPERKRGGADVDAETVRSRKKQICTAPQGSPEGAASYKPPLACSFFFHFFLHEQKEMERSPRPQAELPPRRGKK